MQRCQSGRSCSLGTAVYGSVPRVRIPISAPAPKKRLYLAVFYFLSLIKVQNICIETGCAFCTKIALAIYSNLYSLLPNASILVPKYTLFVRIDESFDLCAKKSYISQLANSYSIKIFESQLDYKLFCRNTKNIALVLKVFKYSIKLKPSSIKNRHVNLLML